MNYKANDIVFIKKLSVKTVFKFVDCGEIGIIVSEEEAKKHLPGNYQSTVFWKDVDNVYFCSGEKLRVEVLELPNSQEFEIGERVQVISLPKGAVTKCEYGHRWRTIHLDDNTMEVCCVYVNYKSKNCTELGDRGFELEDTYEVLVSLPDTPKEKEEITMKCIEVAEGEVEFVPTETPYSKRLLNISPDSEEWFNGFMGGRQGKSGPLRTDQEIIEESLNVTFQTTRMGTFSIPALVFLKWAEENIEGFPKGSGVLDEPIELEVTSTEFGWDDEFYNVIEQNGKLKVGGM